MKLKSSNKFIFKYLVNKIITDNNIFDFFNHLPLFNK